MAGTPENVLLDDHLARLQVTEQLQLAEAVKGRIWKGPDIVVPQEELVPARDDHRITVRIEPTSLPPMEYLSASALRFLEFSMRSRLAQLGLSAVEWYIGEQVGAAMRTAFPFRNSEAGFTRPFDARITVSNRCARPIKLEAGEKLGRFFYRRTIPNLENGDLVSAVKSGLIGLEGDYGTDWFWAMIEDPRTGEEKIIGVYKKIKEENRFWIPPHSQNKPVEVDSQIRDYRDVIKNKYGEELPIVDEEILWIGETNRMTLNEGVDAVIERTAWIDRDTGKLREWGNHIASRLIPGGKSSVGDGKATDWPIRLEIESWPQNPPNYVLFTFMRTV